MGANSLNSGIDIDRAKYERENRINPPKYAPGQEPTKTQEPVSMGDLFSGGAKTTDNTPQEVDSEGTDEAFWKDWKWTSSYDDVFSRPQDKYDPFIKNFDGFNTGNYRGPSYNGMIQPYYPQQSGFTYEKAEELAVKGVKGLASIVKSLTMVTPLFWYDYCGKLMIVGIVLAVMGLLFWAFDIGNPFEMIVAGITLAVGSLGVAMILKDTASKYTSEYKEEPLKEDDNKDKNTFAEKDCDKQPSYLNMTVDKLDDYDTEDESENESIEDDDFDLDDIDLNNLPFEKPSMKVNREEVLNKVQTIPKGMYTRRYLYDTFTRLIPNICPDFSMLKEITAEDRAFYEMESAVRESAEVTGCKENIELIKLYENYATILVTTSRPTGLKLEAVAAELACIYAHRCTDITTDEGRSRVYAKAEAVGKTVIFTIFTGKTEMISLKDMYKQCEDYILDSKNYLPVVFGIDPMAKVIKYDLKNLESIIISGMPRSGKSWFAQNIITQMAAFTSPKELQFYICDPKGDISDFRPFCLPHVKRFVTSDIEIMQTLGLLIKKEAPRRKKIIGAGNNLTASQNIWDFKARYPDVEGLPIIYVVIDEVVTLASRMDKDTFSEFRSMLRELISQLPALGIRAILIPHVLKNDIIEKKTSDLVLCRVSVCGNAEHIETVTGAKPKDFPYQLTLPGDLSVCMPPVSQRVMYLRAPVLTATNAENRELFDYMRRVWTKLEPDTVSGSVADGIATDTIDSDYMLSDDDIDNLDIFAVDEAEISRGFRRLIGVD